MSIYTEFSNTEQSLRNITTVLDELAGTMVGISSGQDETNEHLRSIAESLKVLADNVTSSGFEVTRG